MVERNSRWYSHHAYFMFAFDMLLLPLFLFQNYIKNTLNTHDTHMYKPNTHEQSVVAGNTMWALQHTKVADTTDTHHRTPKNELHRMAI